MAAFVLYMVTYISGIIIRYITEMPKYAHLERHPKFFAASLFYDKEGRFEGELAKQMINEDGSFKDMVDLGPWGNGSHYIAINNADAFRQILTDPDTYPKSPPSYAWFSQLVGRGLVTMSLEEGWYAERKRITPLFHFGILKKLNDVMVEKTNKLVAFLDDPANAGQFHLAKALYSTHAMRIINYLAFGDYFDAEWISEVVYDYSHAFSKWTIGFCAVGDLWHYLPFSRFFSDKRTILKQHIAKAIQQRRLDLVEDPERNTDLIYYLITARDEDGQELEESRIVDECLTFLFAGHDTSATGLTWASYFLAKNPRCMKAMQAEVDRVLEGRNPTSEDINQLEYTKSVVKETLRMCPPISFFDKMSTKDTEILGQRIPKGTFLCMFTYGPAHDTRYWKQPFEFRPERFVEDEEAHTYALLPFSAGQRNCIGQKFAMQEMILTLAMLAQRYDIAYDDSKHVYAVYEAVMEPRDLYIKYSPRVF